MTPRQVELIESSWAKVEPIADTAADMFYKRLFELDPGLKSLFVNADPKEQGVKLMKMLGVAVHGLDRLNSLVPIFQKLGRRHVGYGVKPQDYDTVAAAFLWTLEKGLGSAFTPEVKEAWVTVYTVLATTMKEA